MKAAVRRAARAARPIATALRAAQRAPRLTIVGWHRVDDSGTALSTPVEVFRRQLDVLDRTGAAVLPLDHAARLLATGGLPGRATVLTFDDGYASVLETAWPLLREFGWPATLFAVTGYLAAGAQLPWDGGVPSGEHTRLATAGELAVAAKDGLDVGSHTVTHGWLPHLSRVDMAEEMAQSRDCLQELLDRPVRSVAYPMGGWNAEVRDAASAAGYSFGITVDRGTNAQRQHRLALRRAFAPTRVDDFELLLVGAYTWLRPVDSWRTRHGAPW